LRTREPPRLEPCRTLVPQGNRTNHYLLVTCGFASSLMLT